MASGLSGRPRMCIQPDSSSAGVALPSPLHTLTILFPYSPGPPTPLGPNTQNELAATPREDVCSYLGYVHLCERGESIFIPF